MSSSGSWRVKILPMPEESRKANEASASFGRVSKDSRGRPDNDNYGVNRNRLALEQKGIQVSQRTVYRAMTKHGWLHARRRIPHGITKSSSEVQERENLLKGDFRSFEPMKKFITDITEVQCSIYLRDHGLLFRRDNGS